MADVRRFIDLLQAPVDEGDVEVATPAAPGAVAAAEWTGRAPRVAARAAFASVSACGSSVDGDSGCEPDRVLPPDPLPASDISPAPRLQVL